ncbi:ACT domain-containing protein [Flagellimonas sp. 2504JD1-5]
MSDNSNLKAILSNLQLELNEGDFVFASVDDSFQFDLNMVHGIFKEKEGTSLIMKKEIADSIDLKYDYVAACITLNTDSPIPLETVGLTATISNVLANEGISFNVVAAYYHDHIFIERQGVQHAMEVLQQLTNYYNSKK